ncbi:MAG TPA: hypothetical protein VI168_08515 [Croceibacterium sp.]
MFRTAILPAVLLTACATPQAGAQSPAATVPAYRAIGFEIETWGRPLGSWEVQADGTVRHTKIDGSPFGKHQVEQRTFTVDATAYAALAAIAAELPQPRLARADCQELATDLPYGTVRLANGKGTEEVRFDNGCRDAPYRAFIAQLQAMDALVGGWAGQHAPTSVEEVGDD